MVVMFIAILDCWHLECFFHIILVNMLDMFQIWTPLFQGSFPWKSSTKCRTKKLETVRGASEKGWWWLVWEACFGFRGVLLGNQVMWKSESKKSWYALVLCMCNMFLISGSCVGFCWSTLVGFSPQFWKDDSLDIFWRIWRLNDIWMINYCIHHINVRFPKWIGV